MTSEGHNHAMIPSGYKMDYDFHKLLLEFTLFFKINSIINTSSFYNDDYDNLLTLFHHNFINMVKSTLTITIKSFNQ